MGIPFTAVPARSLNSASRSSATSPIPWMWGVAFREKPRSSNVNEGGGTYEGLPVMVPPLLTLPPLLIVIHETLVTGAHVQPEGALTVNVLCSPLADAVTEVGVRV